MSTDQLARGFDASIPPARPVPGCTVVNGYIGGATPHVWTRDEWNAASGGGTLAQGPIWVADLGYSATGQAQAAAAKAVSLGWAAHHGPPGAWRFIFADMEASQDEPWLHEFGNELQRLGFLCSPYMSQSALPGDPPGYTVWLADWNGLADIPPIHDVIGHQYRPNVPWLGTRVDLSAWSPSALASFGRGPRR